MFGMLFFIFEEYHSNIKTSNMSFLILACYSLYVKKIIPFLKFTRFYNLQISKLLIKKMGQQSEFSEGEKKRKIEWINTKISDIFT